MLELLIQMDRCRERYYRLCEMHLLVIGLWPYNSSRIQKLKIIVCFILFGSSIVSQITPYMTVHYTPTDIIKSCSHIGVAIYFFFRYFTFYFQMETIREYLEIVKYDWNDVQNERELAIMKEYTRLGRFYVLRYILFIYATLFPVVTSPLSADVLNWIIPLNESRQHRLPIRMDILIDQDTYFYLNAFAFGFVCFVGCVLCVGTDGITTMWALHVSGVSAIVRLSLNSETLFEDYHTSIILRSYRIRQAFVCNSQQIRITERNTEMTKCLANAVNMHIKATKFINRFKSNLLNIYLCVIIMAVVTQTSNLYIISQALVHHKIEDLYMYGFCSIANFSYTFYFCYIFDQIIDSHRSILVQLYNTEWYEAPLRVKKLILFMMLKCSIPLSLNVLGVVTLSLEGYLLIVKVTMSFFTVISSIALEN